MKYLSLTTPNIEHDEANLLAEFIWLNHDIRADIYPWKGQNIRKWSKLVAALKKLMHEPYNLSAEQLAFYIWKCKPIYINPPEFAKMAVVAQRLFQRYDLEQVHRLYLDLRENLASSHLEGASYKQEKPKSLLTFLRELESGTIKTNGE